MSTLKSICLSIIISIIVRAYALPIVLGFVVFRNWLFVVFGSEEGRAHGEELLANVRYEIAEYREKGEPSDVIAFKIFISLVVGLPSDIAWCAHFIPARVADKVAGLSDNLRHLRVSAVMVAGVATLGLINYSLFSSSHHQPISTKLMANGMVIALTILLANIKRPRVRRIFNSLTGVGIAGMMGFVVWLAFHFHAYALPWFQVYSLGFLVVAPAIQVFDKPWSAGLTSGRRFLFIVCWGLAIAVSLAGSQILAGSVMPMFSLWDAMALFAGGMFLVFGAITFIAYLLCSLGIRGGSGGLRLVSSGLRRLR
jgi:hypothetical protein